MSSMSSTVSSIESSLLCPRCQGELSFGTPSHCLRCAAEFPSVAGIPLLVNEPADLLSSFSAGLAVLKRDTETMTSQLARQLVQAATTERARVRLQLVMQGLERRVTTILKLFSDAGIEPLVDPHPKSVEPADLLKYLALVFRDFAWAPEVDEVTPAVEKIKAMVPADYHMGSTLVLGAGTGRLAIELGHQFAEDSPILALDINPLPLLLTRRLLARKVFQLDELPAHPRRSTFAAVSQLLVLNTPAPPRFSLVFADGLRPPVAPASQDTIVVPWFLDQVAPDLAEVVPRIHRLLRPGGVLLFQGPFVYRPELTPPRARYAADEFVDLVKNAGFSVLGADYAPTSYMASPLSAQGRVEWVLTLVARRDGASSGRPDPEPEFLRPSGVDESVPRFFDRGRLTLPNHPLVREVARLIDGKRSVSSLVDVLIAEGHLADDEDALAAVVACLRLIHRSVR